MIEFYGGLLAGIPIGALFLVIGVGVFEQLAKQRAARRATERYRLDLAEDKTRRYVALCLAPYASDAKLELRPIVDRVNRVKGRMVLRDRFGAASE